MTINATRAFMTASVTLRLVARHDSDSRNAAEPARAFRRTVCVPFVHCPIVQVMSSGEKKNIARVSVTMPRHERAFYCYSSHRRRQPVHNHRRARVRFAAKLVSGAARSEEHTSELQSPVHIVCGP